MNIIEAKMSRYGVVNLRNDDNINTAADDATITAMINSNITTDTMLSTTTMLIDDVDEFSR